MTSKTKADLQRELAERDAEVAALRDLLAAVRETATIPYPANGHWDAREKLEEKRFGAIRDWLRDGDTEQLHQDARLFRRRLDPVTYPVVCGQWLKELPGFKTCQLDPGHDGGHSPELPGDEAESARLLADATAVTEVVAEAGNPPSAAEVYAAHKGSLDDTPIDLWPSLYGPHKPSAEAAAAHNGTLKPCQSVSDQGTPCTSPVPLHPMPHRDADGSEWDDTRLADDEGPCTCGHGYDSHSLLVNVGTRLDCDARPFEQRCECRKYEPAPVTEPHAADDDAPDYLVRLACGHKILIPGDRLYAYQPGSRAICTEHGWQDIVPAGEALAGVQQNGA